MLNRLFTGIATSDLTQDFDTARNKRSLLKLENHGIRGSALNLMTSNPDPL